MRETWTIVGVLAGLMAMWLALVPLQGPLGVDCGPPALRALSTGHVDDDLQRALEENCRARSRQRVLIAGVPGVVALAAFIIVYDRRQTAGHYWSPPPPPPPPPSGGGGSYF